MVEEQVGCADDAKAIVGGYQLRTGLVGLGNDSRPKIRAFKLYNPTGAPLQADLYVRCLAVRTHSALAGTDLSVVNTASASTTTPESSYDDNTDSAGSTFDPINISRPAIATPASGAVRVAARSVTTSVRCGSGGSACTGTATLVVTRTQRAGGRTIRRGTVLARSTYRMAPGTIGTVRLVATSAGSKALKARGLNRATLRVGTASRAVTVRR